MFRLNTKILPNTYYVYALCTPDEKPFYIGKGINRRCTHHFQPSQLDRDPNKHKVNTIKSLDNTVIKILAYLNNEQEALDLEQKLISYYGRRDIKTGVLTNLTDGGEGHHKGSNKTNQLKWINSFSKRPRSGYHIENQKLSMILNSDDFLIKSGDRYFYVVCQKKFCQDLPDICKHPTYIRRSIRNSKPSAGILAKKISKDFRKTDRWWFEMNENEFQSLWQRTA